MAHPDVPAEQIYVDHAYGRLGAMRAAAAEMLADAFEERGGTFQSLTERDIRVRTSLGRLEQLGLGRESLIFGRIDHQAAEGENEESFHIGRLAVSDVDQEPLVVDWRAPVAEPFYRATGAHPMHLRRRRHLLTDGPRVVDLEDELFDAEGDDEGVGLGLAGPQVLLATLERARTGRMRDIVATVQREQDEIIRAPLPGILVVQGGPGTGKTAVALHRAAYLLYTHRFPLETQGVLVVGPNPTFLRYIEHVLPSLGESGVELSTISGLIADVSATGGTAPEGRTASDDTETERLKGDPRMARVVAHAVRDRERPLRRPFEVPYGRTTLRLSVEASAQMVAAARRRPGTHNGRRRSLENLLWRHLAEQLARRTEQSASPDGPELPSPAELGRELRRVPDVAEALDRMWPVLSPAELLHDLFGAPPLVELATRGLIDPAEAKRLHRPRSARPADAPRSGADVPLLDEASALLGPARRHRAGDEDHIRSYGHIIVDEAQDLSPMQLRMLARRSLSGSMTVVGDVAQATGAWGPRTWAGVVAYLPSGPAGLGGHQQRRPWRQVELTVNYRTPSEIMALAAQVLAATAPTMTPPDSVRASGELPRFVAVDAGGGDPLAAVGRAVVDAVASVQAEDARGREDAMGAASGGADPGEGTVAVIVPPSLHDPMRNALAAAEVTVGWARGSGAPAGGGARGSGAPAAGGARGSGAPAGGGVGHDALDTTVSVLALGDAKGLEFDSVVVVEPAALVREMPQGLRSVYVAMTRPTRRLIIVHREALPESLVGA